MLVVHVHVSVKKSKIEAFKQASLENVRNSLKESGVARFDVIQQIEDPTKFVLVEVYRTADDAAKHKETIHYATWRDTVANMMENPRHSIKYENIFPDDDEW